jgi:hypothetical protein
MTATKFRVSAPQLFLLLLFYLLSGMMLFAGGSFFPALFSSLFAACLSALAFALCGRGSSAELYAIAFGAFASPLRLCAAFFSALPLAGTLAAFSEDISAFHGEAAAPLAPLLALFAVFGVCGGFCRAARFSELCVFALAGACILALFGGGGGMSFGFPEGALFAGFDTVGAPAVFFSLYLRCVTPENGEASVYLKNSAFHPSPLAAGVLAPFAALALYSYFCFAGNNILFSLLSWFFMLSRLLALSVCIADLLAYPEKKEGAKCALLSCAFCAFWVVFPSLFAGVAANVQAFTAVILPCALFICSVFARKKSARAHYE